MKQKVCGIKDFFKERLYPGRGILVGLEPEGKHLLTAYFIMGRSDNSRNRIFYKQGDDLYTGAFDAAKVEDPSLIIYRALVSYEHNLIISNGDQTDTVYQEFLSNYQHFRELHKQLGTEENSAKAAATATFMSALSKRVYEPDAPNYTPRISALVNTDKQATYTFSILKRQHFASEPTAYQYFTYEALPAYAHFLHTYEEQDESGVLPSFRGEPKLLSLEAAADIDSFATSLWEALNTENKISLYVRYTNLQDASYQERLFNKNI